MPAVELPVAAEEFLTWLAVEKGRAPNTLMAYRRDLARYREFLDHRGVAFDEVRSSDLLDYLHSLREQGMAASSRARASVAVRSLHRFLLEEGLCDTNPAGDLEAVRVAPGLPRPLSEAEVERLLVSVVGPEPVARRDRAILETLYGSGVRISELCGLSLSDLDLDAESLRVLGKGSKERLVPVGRVARHALAAWLDPEGRPRMHPESWARRDDAEALFLSQRGRRLTRQGVWGIVKRYGDSAGLTDRLSPHVLRHSCATHMLDHGADIRVVQELLGHASISTTQVYTRVSTERLQAVYDACHPRARGRPGRSAVQR
ncbi:MAG: Tyrosine recombinase XerD [Acidimicrobiales bacterium]|nr:MAG: site-specific tyrosine recombinase XerD [Actinomycetota bacterium]MBV6507139.1 Tyrosine recombinase XerD [Acidimicrobiales bacterium]RIK05564.1 MAG: site-specific tyrosine recombinase XerD [Acidobacteriota bacterium]